MENGNYTAKTNKHGQIVIVRAETAHLPHVCVTWYGGGIWEGGHAPVLPGETELEAAQRAYLRHVSPQHLGTFTVHPAEFID